jgi:hypothetical protein
MLLSSKPARTLKSSATLQTLLAACTLLATCSTVFAQPVVSLRYLLFDPVLIQVEEQASDAPYSITELTPLPAGKAVDLRSWLAIQTIQESDQDQETLESQLAYFRASIARIELQDGAFSARLSQELQAQGDTLLQAGDIDSALDAYDRAAHIIRVNSGLFSLDQIPVIESIIEAHLTRGDMISANEEQEYLYYLQHKAYGDANPDQLLQALNSFAEWNLYAFNTNYFEVSSVADAKSSTPVNSLTFQAFRAQSLLKAQMLYMQIVDILTHGFGQSDPRLPEAEKALAVTSYLYLTNFDLAEDFATDQRPYDFAMMPKNTLGSRMGNDALERRVEYLKSLENADPEVLTAARLDLADWQLFSRKRSNSLDLIVQAWEEAQNLGMPQDRMDAIFAPPLPEMIPAFAHPRYSRAALKIPDDLVLAYRGFIDVDYTLNKYGQIRTSHVIGATADTPQEISERLLRYLRRSQFRPRLHDGEFIESDRVTVRYYYTY